MSTPTIGSQKYFNTTATASQKPLSVGTSYSPNNSTIFQVGLAAGEVIIHNKNGTFANGVRVCFDDSTGIAAGEYVVIPGGVGPVVMHPNLKHTIYVQRDSSTDVDISICVVRKNSFNSF